MQSLKSSTLRDFGIDGVCQGASSSSKKLHFDNAMLSYQEREIAKKKELRDAHMRDFGIAEDETPHQTIKLNFEKTFVSEHQQREAQRIDRSIARRLLMQ